MQIAVERGADAQDAQRRGHPARARQLQEESEYQWRIWRQLYDTARAVERESTEAFREEEEEESETTSVPELVQNAQRGGASASQEAQPTDQPPKQEASQPASGRGFRHMIQGPGRAPVDMGQDGHRPMAPDGTPFVRSIFATDACFASRRVWPQQQQRQQQTESEPQEVVAARLLPAFRARKTTILINILEDLGRAFDAGNARQLRKGLQELDAWQLLAMDGERAHGAFMVGFAMRWLESFLNQSNTPQILPDLLGDLEDFSEETRQAARRIAPVVDSNAELVAMMLRTCEEALPAEMVEASRRLASGPEFNAIGRAPAGLPRYEHEHVPQTVVEPVFFSTMRLPSPQLHWEEAAGVHRDDALLAATHAALMDVFSHQEPNVPPRPPW